MIKNINELNRILIATSQLTPDPKIGAREREVVRYCDIVILGDFADHDETIDFSIQVGLLERRKERIFLSTKGIDFFNLSNGHAYELNQSQKEFFINNCLFESALSNQVKKVLAQFAPDYDTQRFQWSKIDDPPLRGDSLLIEIMKQANLILEKGDLYIIAPDYAATVDSFVNDTKFLSPEDLLEKRRRQEELGAIAEQMILDYEKQRLRKLGHIIESESIQWVSKLNVSAGYDIRSFDARSKNLVHNRFIEVKGSARKTIHFFWSSNEIEAAKRLGDRYWLYYQPLRSLNSASNPEPIVIRNPYKNIWSNKNFKKKCTEYEITIEDEPEGEKNYRYR
jgi:hypothetical protein